VGWEIIATRVEEPHDRWHWSWRRSSDDAPDTRASRRFESLEACIADAKAHGFEDEEIAALISSCE
jgi:hypothetical protein